MSTRRVVTGCLATVLLLASHASQAQSQDAAFAALAERYISELSEVSPVNATGLGDHSADHELDQVDAAGRKRVRERYLGYRKELEAIDRKKLSRANQVDAALLRNDIESTLWSMETLQEWAWNPLVYVQLAGNAIYGLVARDFAPLEERLGNAASRLEQLPRFLAQARKSIDPARVPKIHAETAIQQNPGLNSIMDHMIVPHLDSLAPETRSALEAAMETARDSLAVHQTWLEEELLPKSTGDFRIGAALYDRKLALTLDSPLNRRQIKARAEQEYESVRLQMYEVAKQVYLRTHPYTTFPDSPDESYKQSIIRSALEQAYQKLPPRDGIVEVIEGQIEQTTDFVREKSLVTVPRDPLEIIIMPEFQRGVAVAYLDPPGPLDKDQPAFYAVAPLPDDWTDEQVTSFLREYNLLSLQDLTMHEAMPGHYLQLSRSNRYPSMLRSVLWSNPFVEGWAVYAERVMIDAGYLNHEPLMRLINLKWYLRAVTNAIIDSAIHVDGMTRDEALKLMIEGGFQEEREAAGKWTRAQLTSTQLSTYFVGYQEHTEMRRAVERRWGEEFTLRRYHDQALSYGSPPVKYVRALILDEPIPVDSH